MVVKVLFVISVDQTEIAAFISAVYAVDFGGFENN